MLFPSWFREPGVVHGLNRLGESLRAARWRMGVSQMWVERMSGVDQTAISRLERSKAPGLAVGRLVLVTTALGRNFPFGWCPHDHQCAWQEPVREGDAARQLPEPLYPGSPAWEALWAPTRARRESQKALAGSHDAPNALDGPDEPDEARDDSHLVRPDVSLIRLPR